ncbi:MAG: N-methyl-L-tryptophan oxidase [Oscillochloris sp.]|nr:N-methyl-L-tryptophan oxidase [Oscillochloris sp.]
MQSTYDAVVIGAGGAGAAAAYHLARRGKRTLLLEQFGINHVRGSSHGASRIIRHSYEKRDYVTLAPAAFALWHELAQISGQPLLRMTGGVDLAPADHPQFTGRITALRAAQLPFDVLEGAAATAAMPQMHIPAGWALLRQPGAGILDADRCVRTMVDQALAHGATLREHTPALAVKPDGDGVLVTINEPDGATQIRADRAIIAAGPWAGRFFNNLGLAAPLRVTHQQVAYFAVTRPELYDPDICPVYITFASQHNKAFYGFPIVEKPGMVKIANELDGPPLDPDTPPLAPDQAALDRLSAMIAERMIGIDPTPQEVVTCRYTQTLDGDFVIDRHPEFPQIVLASPCSGHGFKFTIVTGALLADLALSAAGDYSSPHWRERFRLKA